MGRKINPSQSRANLRILINKVLNLANQPILRFEFLKEVSKMVGEVTGWDMVEISLKENDKHFIAQARRSNWAHTTKSNWEIKILGSEDIPIRLKERGKYSGQISIPLRVGEKRIGTLYLRSRSQSFFKKEEKEIYADLGSILGVAFAYRSAQISLRERIKELTCLYGIAQLVGQPKISLSEILFRIVKLLPPAWLYPQIASARIVLDGVSYSTPNYQEGVDRITADIIVGQKKRGWVEVNYSEKRPQRDEGPFLKEERHLINTVAKEITLLVERKQEESERSKLEEQLRHADRLATIGQLAAGVAHELNEPLGNILGFAELIKKSPSLPSHLTEDVEKVIKASLHAREVIKKLMFFARQLPPQKKKVDLNQIVMDGLYFLESRCLRAGIEVIKRLSSQPLEITADPSQLHQVLVNLVVNAIQAMPNGGRLTIQTKRSKRYASLIIEDTGIGMSEEVKRQIFVPFFTTKEVGQGTGLGLPVVHGIVTAHGGQIKVESEVGGGSKFEVQFPIMNTNYV